MALPRVTLTGTYTEPDGTPIQGWIDFCPPSVLTFADEPQFIACCSRAVLDENGQFTIQLVATDAPGSNVDGTWQYRVSEFLQCDNGERTYFIELPADSSPIDLAQIAPTTSPIPVSYLRLPGPQGPAGEPAESGVTLSTGVIRGGALLHSATPDAVDVTAMEGFVVDEATDPANPSVVRVQTPDQTVLLDAPALLGGVTWLSVDASGQVLQSQVKPGPVARREAIFLGGASYNPVAGEVLVVASVPQVLAQPVNQFLDLAQSLGSFVVAGLDLSPGGTDRSLNLTQGRMFAAGFANYTGTGDFTRDPHVVPFGDRSQFVFRMVTRQFTGGEPQVNQVDVANFDSGGVVTPIPGGSDRSSVLLVWLSPNADVGDDILIQYGQAHYPSLSDALDSIGTTRRVVDDVVRENLTLIGYVVATRTATDLSDITQARLVRPNRFPRP